MLTWHLANTNVKDPQAVIYDSIKLKHNKYQQYRDAMIGINKLNPLFDT